MENDSPNPPQLDQSVVQRLAALASEIDGCQEPRADELVQEFNSLAGTDIPYSEFQGIYGAEDHEDFVRRVLTAKLTNANSTIGHAELTQMFARISANPSDDAYLSFVFSTIEKTFDDAQVSDLVFWPGDYFGDGDNSRELTPKQMADAVLERHNQKGAR